MTLTDAFLQARGGRLVMDHRAEGGQFWDFGWIPPFRRTREQQEADNAIRAEMPRFKIRGRSRAGSSDRALLYELWKHPLVVAANGFEYPGNHQLTGSCVGAGGGNAWFTLQCVEAVRLNQAEAPVVPFWLLPYGRSRYYLGAKTPGEGSTGGAFAKAARTDGVIEATSTGLPPFENTDGLIWGSAAELSWSDGDASQTFYLLPHSKKHLVKTTAYCRSASDVRESLCNGFPCTCASQYAHDGGTVQGEPPILLAAKKGAWGHQMSLLAWLKHPQLGEVYWCMNQWGQKAHGHDPFGGPAGGVWITSKDVDWMCRTGEVIAFSQFDGFPADPDVPPEPDPDPDDVGGRIEINLDDKVVRYPAGWRAEELPGG